MAEPELLHLVRVRLETRRLFDLGRRRRLPMRDVDLDYLVHCQLGELFGRNAPAPFRILGTERRWTDVLGYSTEGAEALDEHARTFADPGIWQAVDWETFAAKPMPSHWRKGQVLGFEVRACPIVRKARAGEKHREGAEVDAFLSKAWEDPQADLERETVYGQWLRDQVQSRGAEVLDARLERFKLVRLVRRRQGEQRTSAVFQRPEALFRGRLEVADPQPFQRLLARGVGRHRAFGFGMILLRPA